jgi:hypothetical protein
MCLGFQGQRLVFRSFSPWHQKLQRERKLRMKRAKERVASRAIVVWSLASTSILKMEAIRTSETSRFLRPFAPMIHTDFILVGCILLSYLYMLYKHTTQELYICDPQMQLNFFLLFQNFTTCFTSRWPLRAETCSEILEE